MLPRVSCGDRVRTSHTRRHTSGSATSRHPLPLTPTVTCPSLGRNAALLASAVSAGGKPPPAQGCRSGTIPHHPPGPLHLLPQLHLLGCPGLGRGQLCCGPRQVCWPRGGGLHCRWPGLALHLPPVSGVDEQGTVGVSKGDTRKGSESAEATRKKRLPREDSESPKAPGLWSDPSGAGGGGAGEPQAAPAWS